ncbi:MAG: hypothetical protein PHG66_01620 [Candidatus Colwellbacteria bacterium]|nr:hypothetical protein [Candidatus Colwellbacteria bacterium]
MKPETRTLLSEIASAMFRVASIIKHEGLKSSLENLAVRLAAEESIESIRRSENLIVLGRETGDIKDVNAEVLLKALADLRSLLKIAPEVAEIDLSDAFSVSAPSVGSSIPMAKPSILVSHVRQAKSAGLDDVAQAPKLRNTNLAKKHGSISADRINTYIQEHGQARLKELESAFREVSGRTVRRMTDTLIREGKIERVGNPGPTSYYRPKIVIPPIPMSGFNSANSRPETPPSVIAL